MDSADKSESIEGEGLTPDGDAPSGRKLALALLKLRDFRFALLGSGVLVFSFQMRAIVQSWLALELTDSQAWVGAVNGLPAVVSIALSLLGGLAADRFPKRDILVVMRLGLVGLALVVGYLVAIDIITIWHLLALTLVQGGITAFTMPAAQSIVAELVGREKMLTAVSLTQTLSSLGMIVGPALGGFLVGFFGVAPVYFIVGGIQFLGVVATALIRSRNVHGGNESKSALSDIADGLLYVRENSVIRILMTLNVLGIFAGFMFPLIPVYARDILDVGEMGFGLMMTAFGLGGVVGTVGLAMAGNVRRKGLLPIGAGVIWLIGTFVFAFSREFYLSLAVLAVMGAGGIAYMTTINAMVQMTIPDELRGRVTSLFSITMQLFPIGYFVGGLLAAAVNNEFALMVSGIGVMLPVVLVYARSEELRRQTTADSD